MNYLSLCWFCAYYLLELFLTIFFLEYAGVYICIEREKMVPYKNNHLTPDRASRGCILDSIVIELDDFRLHCQHKQLCSVLLDSN
uniref:Uncharacterized protein n=1 Tax=Arundo donax TaxID=35708 RepID=A0A0A9E642_ARUDO